MRSVSKALIIMAAVLTLIGSSFAQSPKRFRTSIPFDFSVDGKKMPAGTYTVTINPEYKMISFDSAEQLLSARVIYRMTTSKSSSKQLQLQFSADNSFEGFRDVEDGGITTASGEKVLAKNVKTNAPKGSAD
jgi:hypothetical protein